APLILTELEFDPVDGPVAEQLTRHFDPREHRIDLGQAPLLRFAAARDEQGRWLLIELLHHLIGDHSTVEILHREVRAILAGHAAQLPSPQPFRNLVAQAHLGVSRQEHETFFRAMLADVEEPTLPFGLTEVHLDGSRLNEAHHTLPSPLNDRLRAQARRLGVSLASLCHLAWAQVLARASGQDRVVFGTVMFGRMQAGEGADQAMGLYINTLPLRMDLGETGVEQAVRDTHALLASLIDHEHASLALAQQCSGVPAGSPLFSALLNYSLAEALDGTPALPVRQLEILPPEERALLLNTWNGTTSSSCMPNTHPMPSPSSSRIARSATPSSTPRPTGSRTS
uniref:condensation domain-containing protein n=1 Tax=Burkholderia sp. A1 TaxID=148446 RepID=UPI0005BE9324